MYMANAINYQLTQNVPSQKIPMGELNGKIRVMYDSYVFPADVFALNAEIDLGKLPAGARVIEALVKSVSLGTTGIFSLGHRANSELAEDADAFIAAADAGGQAAKALMPAGAAGLLIKFASETQVYLKCTEATDSALNDKIEVLIQYVVD